MDKQDLQKLSSWYSRFAASPAGLYSVLTFLFLWNATTAILYGMQTMITQIGATASVLSIFLLKRDSNTDVHGIHAKLDSLRESLLGKGNKHE